MSASLLSWPRFNTMKPKTEAAINSIKLKMAARKS